MPEVPKSTPVTRRSKTPHRKVRQVNEPQEDWILAPIDNIFSAAEIEAIKARAWDDGFTACAYEHVQQDRDRNHPITRTNPYRNPNV